MLNKRIVVLGAGRKSIWNAIISGEIFRKLLTKIHKTYAGVSGLTTATLLLQQEKAIKVHIVAKHFPGDLSGEYTSPWYLNLLEHYYHFILKFFRRWWYAYNYRAGAHWKSHAAKDKIREQGMYEKTFTLNLIGYWNILPSFFII